MGGGAMLCDQCSVARALYAIALPNGGLLFMCGHHVDRNLIALSDIGALIEPLT